MGIFEFRVKQKNLRNGTWKFEASILKALFNIWLKSLTRKPSLIWTFISINMLGVRVHFAPTIASWNSYFYIFKADILALPLKNGSFPSFTSACLFWPGFSRLVKRFCAIDAVGIPSSTPVAIYAQNIMWRTAVISWFFRARYKGAHGVEVKPCQVFVRWFPNADYRLWISRFRDLQCVILRYLTDDCRGCSPTCDIWSPRPKDVVPPAIQ